MLYLGVLGAEDSGQLREPRVVFLATYIAAIAAAGIAGALVGPPEVRLVLLGAAGGGAFALGVIALFSIGVLLLLAAALISLGAVGVAPAARCPNAVPAALVAGMAAVGTLAVGISLT